MATFLFSIHLPVSYEYGKGWIFSPAVLESKPFDNPVDANHYYDDRIKEQYSIAAMNSSAVKFSIAYEGIEQRMDIYEGESVLLWLAAYHEPGMSELEERYFIDRICFDAGYYNFMYKKEEHPMVIPMACAATIKELKELLGENFDLYEIYDQ